MVFDWNGTLSQGTIGEESGLPHLYPEVREVIEALHHQGLFMAIATMHSQQGLARELAFHQLQSFFIETFTVDDEPTKPNPTLLLNLMSTLDLKPSEVLMVGDTPHDVEYATRAGLSCVIVDRHSRYQEKFSNNKNIKVIQSLSEIIA
jgi:phosphoglycolate phosphatase